MLQTGKSTINCPKVMGGVPNEGVGSDREPAQTQDSVFGAFRPLLLIKWHEPILVVLG